jgi:phage-related protein
VFWEQNLKPCFEAIVSFIEKIIVPVVRWLADVFEEVFNNFIGPAVDTAFQFIKDLWNGTLKPVFTGITDFLTGVFTGNWKKAFQGLINIVKGVFSGLTSVVKAPINQVINIVNSFIKGLNKLKIPDWVPVVGGKGINIPTIPKLEKGGILKKGQMGFLEGSGDEAVVPLHQNRAWISAVAKDMKAESGADNGKLQQIIDMLSDFFPQLMEASGHDIVTNDGVIVAHYAPKLNLELGKISSRKDRGR